MDTVADPGSPPGAARLPHLDDLRTLLVAWVIGGHAILGYTAVGGWAYDEVHEVTFAPVNELLLVAVLGPTGLFVIGVFFFIAGLLTERSITRHGRRPYVHDRLLRLGLPWLVSALLIWPASVWLAYTAAGRGVSFWWVLSHRDPLLDSGSLWFALVLLLYSVAFALAYRAPRAARTPLRGWHLAAAAGFMAASAFLVRLGFPARSGQVGDLHLWQWPQCAGMFALGIVAARHGWHRHVPDRVRRACGLAILLTLVALPVVALASGVRDVATDAGPFLGGAHWQALATAAVEAVLVVAGSVWLVGIAERRTTDPARRSARWSRGAFGAFVIQGPVLMALASAARPLGVPAEVKAPLVCAAAVTLCFWLGRRLPILGVSRMRRPGPPTPDPSAPDPSAPASEPVEGVGLTGESRTVDLGGTVHYVAYGHAAPAPTIVLVHGLGGSHLNWEPVAPLLADRFRVFALDLPGFGLSDPTGRPATVRSNVAVLVRFVREVCGTSVVVVGNSMGGLIGILTAARHADLVRGLILLDPALPIPSRILRSPGDAARLALYALPGVGERLRRRRRLRIGARATVDETLRLCGIEPAALPPDLVARTVALVGRSSDVAGMDRAFLSASRSLAWVLVRARAYHAAMASVRCPVLLVHGTQDKLVPVEAARATARARPGWRYVELPGVGHVPQMQVPEQVAELVVASVNSWPAALLPSGPVTVAAAYRPGGTTDR